MRAMLHTDNPVCRPMADVWLATWENWFLRNTLHAAAWLARLSLRYIMSVSQSIVESFMSLQTAHGNGPPPAFDTA